MFRHDMNSVTLGELLDDPEAASIIGRVAPGSSTHPFATLMRQMKAIDALSAASGKLTAEQRDALVSETGAL